MNKNKKNKFSINQGRLRLFCDGKGIKIYWDNQEVTQGVGLNVAISTFGIWTDSSKASWELLEGGRDYFKFKVRFAYLPVIQNWSLKIENEEEVSWEIILEAEEDLHIDESRVVCLVSWQYKTWISGYEQGDFPRISTWQDMPLINTLGGIVGVRFPVEGAVLPSLGLEVSENGFGHIYPLIQNTSTEINAHIMGSKVIGDMDKRYYVVGKHNFFSGKITLFEDDALLDKKIERTRKLYFKDIQKSLAGVSKNPKVLLVNLPWERDGNWGVRAGSRWPHIKDKSEGVYLPFPFFMAYAFSLLKENEIEVSIIDAVAEQIHEEQFIKNIMAMDFNFLVAETSVPSFYEDMRMLEKISQKARVQIILCGPNHEIYQPQFLREHPFIDFVLYGEYEFTLLELVKVFRKNKELSSINGLIWRDGDKVVKNPPRELCDINLLPWPYREGLPMAKYLDLPGNIPAPSAQMFASRGCPFGCNFCLWPQVLYQGNHYRTRDLEDVVEEMEFLIKKMGFKSVYFDDDTFNIGKERMLAFCGLVKKRGLQNTPWAIMARADLMDEEILAEMKSAGLWAVKYGVESACQFLIEDCHKGMLLEKNTQMIKATKDLGIKVHLTFTFGHSGETTETIRQTIEHALRLEPDSVQFSIVTPFPGTKLFEEMDKEGRILTKDWSKYDGHQSCVFQPRNMTPADLTEAKMRAYRLWGDYLRKKRGIWGDVKRFKENLKDYGFSRAFHKTIDYLEFCWIKRRKYLDGTN